MTVSCDTNTDRCYRDGANSAPSGDFTAAFWWRTPAVLDQQYDAIFWMGTQTAGANAYDDSIMIVIGNPANTIEVWARNSTAPRAGPTASLVASTWYHVALVGNTGTGQNLTLYLDGVSAATGTSGANGTYQTTRLEIGNDANSDNSATSRFAYFTLHNSQLSIDRIRANAYNFQYACADAWTAATLFDDADGLADLSGNGRSFTELNTLTINATDCPGSFDEPWPGYFAQSGPPPGASPGSSEGRAVVWRRRPRPSGLSWGLTSREWW